MNLEEDLFYRPISVFSERPFKRLRPKKGRFSVAWTTEGEGAGFPRLRRAALRSSSRRAWFLVACLALPAVAGAAFWSIAKLAKPSYVPVYRTAYRARKVGRLLDAGGRGVPSPQVARHRGRPPSRQPESQRLHRAPPGSSFSSPDGCRAANSLPMTEVLYINILKLPESSQNYILHSFEDNEH